MSIILGDRLVWLLERFSLRAKVFQAGPLNCAAAFPAEAGVGYLHVVQSGGLRILDKGRPRVEVNEPSVFIYMNPVTTRLEPLDSDLRMVCASFEFGLGEGNPLQQAMPDRVLLKLVEFPLLQQTLNQIFVEAAEHHCGRQAVLDRFMEVVLILILRELMDQQRLEFGLLAGLADTRLAKAINAMHADPAENWTLDSLAEVAGMSRARFAENFRNTVGMTPGAYLSEWRLGVAQSMLLQGKPVKMVAADVGYGSASALSRVFAARRGKSPSEWLRSRHR